MWLAGVSVHSTVVAAMSLKADSALAAPEAAERTAARTGSVALLPETGIYMQKGGEFVTWGSGMDPASGSDAQVWYMRKCSGTDATACLGYDSAWTSTTSALLSGDVVAWHNKQSGRVYDCAHGGCTYQPYPPPGGHWGTPYRIIKLSIGLRLGGCSGIPL
ncbi:unnamed protein product [Prorocentrum cordatum]|uniref:Uncharacterized protein n=1 Tax=Prorocentrum cordatum TaxID=2364126 RepID=A0ABN9SFZ1_9DINO|nr:unnamed protein product [Polarella glacialis]